MDPEAFDSLGESSETDEIPGLHFGHAVLARELRIESAAVPIAYIEAECWAGDCEQGAAVYIDGKLSWGSDFGPIEKEGPRRTPISEALARIGVELATAAVDEFASLGLDGKRQTEDWLE